MASVSVKGLMGIRMTSNLQTLGIFSAKHQWETFSRNLEFFCLVLTLKWPQFSQKLKKIKRTLQIKTTF